MMCMVFLGMMESQHEHGFLGDDGDSAWAWSSWGWWRVSMSMVFMGMVESQQEHCLLSDDGQSAWVWSSWEWWAVSMSILGEYGQSVGASSSWEWWAVSLKITDYLLIGFKLFFYQYLLSHVIKILRRLPCVLFSFKLFVLFNPDNL